MQDRDAVVLRQRCRENPVSERSRGDFVMRLAGLLLAALVLQASPALADGPFDRFVAGVTEALEAGGDTGRQRCARFVDVAVDLDVMSRAIGDRLWAQTNAARRQAIETAVRRRMVAECAARARGEGATATVLKARTTGSGGSLTVRVTARAGGDQTITWPLRPGGEWGWKATDVVLDGRSVAFTLRDEVNGVFEASNDIDAAIARIAR
jgi:ABC-type transporter MlaC component